MAIWKQLLLALTAAIAAAAAWIAFHPDAEETLAELGIDWFAGTSSETAAATGANKPQRRFGGDGPASVIVRPVATATINNRLSAIGDGRAIHSVTVNPSVSGRLVQVLRRSGDRIAAGEVIARLDAEAEQIAFDRASLAVKNAEAALNRAEQLQKSNAVSSVQVTDASLALENARLQLRDAELALDRRTVIAPIAGVLGILPIEIGDYVTSSTEIATIDDRSHILVEFRVPERFVNAITIGSSIRAEAISKPGRYFEGTVTAIDNRIERDSRTLRVQADLANENDDLRGGMSFAVAMRFAGDTYAAVDPLAIQWSTEGAFVWAVMDGRAKRVPVRIIQRNIDLVLVDAPLEPGSLVVTEGVQRVRPGAEVAIAGGDEADGQDDAKGEAADAASGS